MTTMKFARGAASTQGASIPAIKHVGPGFSRMRVLCGNREIAPVHSFRIRARVSETEAVDEGFYAFDPMAISRLAPTEAIAAANSQAAGKLLRTAGIEPASGNADVFGSALKREIDKVNEVVKNAGIEPQ